MPIGIIALVLAARFVPESSDRAGRSLDLPGQITAILGLAALTYAFIEANTYGWTSARILTCFIVAAVVARRCSWSSSCAARSPLLQLKFFRNGTFSGANLVGVIVSFAFFGVIFFLSLFMQDVQGYSPTKAGALQLPATLGVMAAAIVSGRIVGRIGARLPITIGLLHDRDGAAVPDGDPARHRLRLVLVLAAAHGRRHRPDHEPDDHRHHGHGARRLAPGMASATSNTMRQVGGVFGIAVLGNLVTHTFTTDLQRGARGVPPARGGRREDHGDGRPGARVGVRTRATGRGHGGARPHHQPVLHERDPRRDVGERHHAARGRADRVPDRPLHGAAPRGGAAAQRGRARSVPRPTARRSSEAGA